MVFWTDGSRLDISKARSGVSNKWHKKRQYFGEKKDSFDAELLAISDALEISIKKMKNGTPTIVRVFIDSHAAITKILDPKVRSVGGAIRNLIYQNALTIRNNRHTLVL